MSADCCHVFLQWNVTEHDGLYKLVLADDWYASNNGDQIVVKTKADPGTRWKILPGSEDSWLLVHICILLSCSITKMHKDQIHRC